MSKSIYCLVFLFITSIMVFTPLPVHTQEISKDAIDHSIERKLFQPFDVLSYGQGDKQDETYVYITKTGKKYHCEDCGYLGKTKIKIKLSLAKKKGYKACLRCEPPNCKK